MSTRAIIALRLPDDSVLATYLHFDGYPDHVLPILRSGYVDPEDALHLIQGGEIRSLPPRPERNQERQARMNRCPWTPCA